MRRPMCLRVKLLSAVLLIQSIISRINCINFQMSLDARNSLDYVFGLKTKLLIRALRGLVQGKGCNSFVWWSHSRSVGCIKNLSRLKSDQRRIIGVNSTTEVQHEIINSFLGNTALKAALDQYFKRGSVSETAAWGVFSHPFPLSVPCDITERGFCLFQRTYFKQ